MEKTEQEKSQAIYEEIVTGMKEWRLDYPKATLRECQLRMKSAVSGSGKVVSRESTDQLPGRYK